MKSDKEFSASESSEPGDLEISILFGLLRFDDPKMTLSQTLLAIPNTFKSILGLVITGVVVYFIYKLYSCGQKKGGLNLITATTCMGQGAWDASVGALLKEGAKTIDKDIDNKDYKSAIKDTFTKPGAGAGFIFESDKLDNTLGKNRVENSIKAYINPATLVVPVAKKILGIGALKAPVHEVNKITAAIAKPAHAFTHDLGKAAKSIKHITHLFH